MLRVERLSVWYDVTEVIRDVTFEVAENEVVALLGGNGAGKTTILNTLSGLLAPRRGTIAIDGRPVEGWHPQTIVKAGMVQVPQGRFVWPGMSVEDNLALGAVTRPRGERAAIAADLDEVFDMFPVLRERRRGYAASLSGGEQQMLAIGRALMSRPAMMLLDEPSMGLAPQVVARIFETVRRLNEEEGVTVLLAEQNANMALATAGYGYILENGRIGLEGTAAELQGNPAVKATYLGL